MKLTDLNPQFYRYEDGGICSVKTLAEADGIMFLCPKCAAGNQHSVLVWFNNGRVPKAAMPGPGRWAASGTGMADLTLSPSIHLFREGGCGWHGWVTNGEAV